MKALRMMLIDLEMMANELLKTHVIMCPHTPPGVFREPAGLPKVTPSSKQSCRDTQF
jgi:hypothetical protein